MRRIMLVLGLFGATAMITWACSSTVTNGEAAAATSGVGGTKSGSGGMGGAAGGPASSTMMSSSSGPMSLCEQACEKLKTTCGFGDVCPMLKAYIDCKSNMADCPGKCVLDADCGKIASILTSSPDPTLQCCLQTCQNGKCDKCANCGASKCGKEGQACTNDKPCAAFLQCAGACNGDAKCANDCAAKNGSAATTALTTCLNKNCMSTCPPFTGGAGAAAGSSSSTGGAPPN